MLEEYRAAFEETAAWWHRENTRPCLVTGRLKRGQLPVKSDANRFWPGVDSNPDLDGLLAEFAAGVEKTEGEYAWLPKIPFRFGGRGTAMTIAYYLGGRVLFGPSTVWVEPVIRNWSDFSVRFDPENPWWQHTLRYLEKAVELSRGRFLVCLPDFGDALTTLALLRGTENLLLDLMDNRSAVIRARDQFLQLWPEFHRACWDIYRRHLPGDNSWLLWAPGRTYACQSDFSAMISPELFRELVVPEIEFLGGYLDYIVWHLDGPEMIKHLDILLDLPQIKAIQWVHGSGHPSVSHWLPLLKRIQAKGKSLVLSCTYGAEEKDILVRELDPVGLYISY
ncbi:MAG TPA: hypothetical protein PKM61_05045 [bacterium]|nr:hypothetical protein [bacterium]